MTGAWWLAATFAIALGPGLAASPAASQPPPPAGGAPVIALEASPAGVAADTVHHRIYVATTNPSALIVVDAAADAVVARIPLAAPPLGVAVDPQLQRAWVTHPAQDLVSVVDVQAGVVLGTFPVGDDPRLPAVDPTTHRVYVPNRGDGTLSVIDGAAMAVVATLDAGPTPAAATVDRLTGDVFVPNGCAGTVSVVNEVLTRPPIQTLGCATNAAVNPVTHRLAVIRSGELLLMDGVSGGFVARAAVGFLQNGMWFAMSSNLVYVAAMTHPNFFFGEGRVYVVDGASGAVVDEVPTGGSFPTGLAYQPATSKVYVGDPVFSRLTVHRVCAGVAVVGCVLPAP